MTYKVLLIGNGAREHAIAKSIVKSGGILYSVMPRENPGIADLSKEFLLSNLNDFSKLERFKFVDYAFIGPENPLSEGITDYLEDKLNIPTCGPRKEVAQIESSKVFARKLMLEKKIDGTPNLRICASLDDFDSAISQMGEKIVIKPDGLTGGKGVKVYGDHFTKMDEGKEYASKLLSTEKSFLIEEKLEGKEFSLQIFTDGTTIYPMPLVRDYKRAYDNEKGPNTGSMGSYSLETHKLPFVEENDLIGASNILKQTLNAIKEKTGMKYRGVLYGQFMKTDKGLFLIEYNVRFGDPEAINVLALLKSDFNENCLAFIDSKPTTVKFEDLATTCVYVVPEGYPDSPIADQPLEISQDIYEHICFASVYRENKAIKTTKSRAVAVIGKGENLELARKEAMSKLPSIKGTIFHRTDVGLLE